MCAVEIVNIIKYSPRVLTYACNWPVGVYCVYHDAGGIVFVRLVEPIPNWATPLRITLPRTISPQWTVQINARVCACET